MRTRANPLGWIEQEMERVRALHRERTTSHATTGPGPEIELEGRRLVHLCSNNYLGLATHPEVVEAAVEATRRFGAGSGASRLVSGGLVVHRELEQRLAALKGTEDAVVFSSGYLANIGAITALTGPGDVIVSDALNHASVIDGCRLSGAGIAVYEHGDVGSLEAAVRNAGKSRRILVVTDTVFSMDGDLAPLEQIAEVCDRYGAILMTDEAHATGLLGDGAGAVAAAGLSGHVPVVVGTLSKALGAAGGFVAGSRDLTSFLRNRARSFIFDTAPPAAPMAAALAALDVCAREPNRRTAALANTKALATGIRSLGYEVPDPAACVVAVMLGTEEAALARAASVRERGVLAPAIRPPSVAEGACRIRVTAMATHTPEMISRAVAAFEP